MPINNTTPNQGYELPDGTNTLAYDVTRIINAITSIDLSVTARPLFSNVTYVGTTSIALNRTSANQSLTGITSIDGSAATLTTARTLWGQSFNGSAAVSGNLTAVGNITGSGAISLTTAAATNLSLTSGTTGSVTLDSGTTGAINIGTGASTKTITLGSSTGTVQLPTAVTKVGQTSLVQGGAVNVTLPTSTGTLVGSGDTGTVTSTMLLDGTILNADVNASAAIAGTKISPDFGSQNVITTGTGTAATFISGAGTVTANGIQVGTGTTYKPGIYSPGTDQLGLSTSGTSRLIFDASGNINIDSNGVYYDKTNKRLGIGTGGPGQLLEVAGNGVFTGGVSGQGAYIGRDGATGGAYYGSQTASVVIAAAGANYIDFQTNSSSRTRIDLSGRLLVGTSTARSNVYNASYAPILQVETTGTLTQRTASFTYNNGGTANGGPVIQLITSRSSTAGGVTLVATDDELGSVQYFGTNGTAPVAAAAITTFSDGTPSATSMPGRLVFSTTPSGSASPTERLRLTNDGVQCYNQPTPATYAAATTLTVADLKTGIITYTGAAATLTLPTGTLTEGGFGGIYTNMTFEWSVINTGAGICTIGAGTAHTIVGSTTVAIGGSARFASRRTAANTFVSYRLN
jgi:hypothetical protein